MNKNLFTILIVIFAIIVVVGILRFVIGGSEDTWFCQNGEWVKHGNPASPMPTAPCGQSANKNESSIIVESPQANETLTSPLLIKGQATGTWFFEALFNTRLEDENGNVLGTAMLLTKDDWMTENFVPFEGTLTFSTTTTPIGKLIFERANPSGLLENSESFEVPVQFNQSETMTVKVFFNNENLDPEYSCNKVFPVERIIPKTQAVGRAALAELLNGPTSEEKAQGYITNINQGVEIQSLTIENGTAKVDFNDQLEYQVGGSCRVAAISAQITETLKQFPTVNEVIISINGRTEDILQP